MKPASTLLLIFFLLVSCSTVNSGNTNRSASTLTMVAQPTDTPTPKPTNTPTLKPTRTPTSTPTPEPGKAAVTGRVMHEDGYPMKDTIIRLGAVVKGSKGLGGSFILDLANSPGTVTDSNGDFLIENFDGGEYVIVVGDVEATGIYEIISEPSGKAKTWTFPADQITDVGVITVKIVIPTPYPTRVPGVYPAPTSYPNP
jgi:hypothetical protein